MENNNELTIYTSCTILGIATIVFSQDMTLMGYALSGVGGLLTAISLVRNVNPYRKLFEACKLKIDDHIPKYLGKRETDYGYCLKFSLPYGMSSDDFIKKQKAIEEYLNRAIEISYNNYRIYIKVFEGGLDKSPPYQFIKTKNKLEFPIGIIFGGKYITVDLEKVVHLLIAGETGSGKSTLLRGIITSIILSSKKIDLHLIDLKHGAEFSVFRKSKSVKSFSKTKEEADETLSKLIKEVERRYNLFYENNVVDITEYNKLKNTYRLNYQVAIIDEFAELQAEKGSISNVEILASMARACGIHLIICTQRPDSKILNGRIKANVPGVIGLKTMNELNSRIIIDQGGLEELKGKGHGLLKYSDLTEFQSFYITNQQARDLIKHTYIEKKKPIEKPKPKIKEIKDFGFLEKLG